MYKIKVFYASEQDLFEIKCLNCDLTVTEFPIDASRTQFVDLSRRSLINLADRGTKKMNFILGEETIIPFYFKDQFDNLVFDNINGDGLYFEIIGSFQSNICVSRDNIEIIFKKQALHMLKITWTDELREEARRCIDEGRGALNMYWPGIIADKL